MGLFSSQSLLKVTSIHVSAPAPNDTELQATQLQRKYDLIWWRPNTEADMASTDPMLYTNPQEVLGIWVSDTFQSGVACFNPKKVQT